MNEPAELAAGWESAYAQHVQAVARVGQSPGNPDLARDASRAAWRLSEAWRALARMDGLPRWVVVAVRQAGDIAEAACRDWQDQAGRPPERPRMQPRPR